MNSFTVALSILSMTIFTQCTKLEPPLPLASEVGADVMPHDIAPIKGTPFDMPQLKRPTFPNLTVNMGEKGMDATQPISELVNHTIDEVNRAGGGTVVIPAGEWISKRIVLKSNVNLHISEGANIVFSGVAEDYLPAVFTRHEGIDIMGPGAFIYANGEDNIAITGKGTIWGPELDAEIRQRPNGPSVVEKDIPVDLPIEERIYDGIDGRTFYRPKSISPINCTNVLIEGITLRRSAQWNVVPIYCDSVIIRGVTVHSEEVPSGDGIDIESSRNVLIEYCTLNCGDDCFTLKAGRADDGLRVGKPTENVVIRHSLALKGHGGITIGSETAGVIRNVYAHDCVFDGTRSGIRYKTRRNRGGGSDNNYFERIRMTNVGKAFTWDLLGHPMYMGELAARKPARAVNHLTPEIKNIHIKNFIVESANEFFTANGIPEIPFSNVTVENGLIYTNKLITALNDADGFTLRNLDIHCQENEINILDGRNITFDDVRFETPTKKIEILVEGEDAQNICFEGGNIEEKKNCYEGVSPFIVNLK